MNFRSRFLSRCTLLGFVLILLLASCLSVQQPETEPEALAPSGLSASEPSEPSAPENLPQTLPGSDYPGKETGSLFFWKLERSAHAHNEDGGAYTSANNPNSEEQGRAMSTVYLLGSVHIGNEEFYPLAEPIQSAFNASNTLVVEVNLDSVNPAEVQAYLAEHSVLSGGVGLSATLSEGEYAALADILSAYNVDIALLERAQPWVVENTISRLQIASSPYSAGQGVDVYLLRDALRSGKAVYGLETVEEQLAVIASLSSGAQVDSLRRTITNYDSLQSELDKLLRLWQSGDISAMTAEIFADFDSPYHSEFVDVLLTRRNRSWLGQILELVERAGEAVLEPETVGGAGLAERAGDQAEGTSPAERAEGQTSIFVAVGTAHLLGENSLVELLIREGFTAERF